MENNQNENQQQNNNENQTSTNSQKNENMIPQSRLNEEIQKKKDLQAQLDKFLKEKEDADIEAKKKQGEFEQLYNTTLSELTPLKEQFDSYKEAFKVVLDAELESVPEDMRDLIPQGSELDQIKWIKQAQSKGLFEKQKVGDFGNNGNNPNNNTTITKEQYKKMSYLERAALATENPTLYKKLTN